MALTEKYQNNFKVQLKSMECKTIYIQGFIFLFVPKQKHLKGKSLGLKTVESNRPLDKSAYQIINFLISQQKICCGYSKEPS